MLCCSSSSHSFFLPQFHKQRLTKGGVGPSSSMSSMAVSLSFGGSGRLPLLKQRPVLDSTGKIAFSSRMSFALPVEEGESRISVTLFERMWSTEVGSADLFSCCASSVSSHPFVALTTQVELIHSSFNLSIRKQI